MAAENGRLLLVGSTDHNLYALEAEDGRRVWATDLKAPVQCDLAQIAVGRHARYVVAAGTGLFCLDGAGQIEWRAELNGVFIGRPTSDGERVYAASSNGNAYAFDLHTGTEQWYTDCVADTDAYGRWINGPIESRLTMLPGGLVLVTTQTTALALDPATGDVRWRTDGSNARLMFTPPRVTAHGLMLFDGKTGTLLLLDPTDGSTLWSFDALTLSWGAAPVATDDPDTYWMLANPGRLIRIDLVARQVTQEFQASVSYTSSTAVLTRDGVLVGAGKDGVIRAIRGVTTGATTR